MLLMAKQLYTNLKIKENLAKKARRRGIYALPPGQRGKGL